MNPFLVNPMSLELYLAGDGQRFTQLISSWASVYFRRCGASNFSVNASSSKPDGGVDGLIDDPQLTESTGWFSPKSVLQFKVGYTDASKAKSELLAQSKNEKERIRDKVIAGFRVVWFIGKALPDLEREKFESELKAAVLTLDADALSPVVIDVNRLAELISRTPGVAIEFASGTALFNTSNVALANPPHTDLREFVPGSNYEAFREDLIRFFLDAADEEPIKYIAGEPGIGKSRSVLEAVESSDEICGRVLYFSDQGKALDFFTLAKQGSWRGHIVIDEYIGTSATTTPVTRKNVPKGFKILLIGHAFETPKNSSRITNHMEPLTEAEVKNALSATYQDLPPFRIQEAVTLSKDNIRLARAICDYYRRNRTSPGLDASTLMAFVTEELERFSDDGFEVLVRLALVPSLLSEERWDFCQIVDIDEAVFTLACQTISARSGIVQTNDHITYIGSPAVAQFALIELWKRDKQLATRILSNPGQFSERILVAINKLPQCTEKVAMLDFFKLPTSNLILMDLLDPKVGRRFLSLMIADPETYLPVLHRLMMGEKGTLAQFPYEGNQLGRHDIIRSLRDLAQFSEYFELCEEVVYAFAREEASSAYSNDASSYWASWFHAFFDHTVYPYEKRLALLDRRLQTGDELDETLVLKAISNPFPNHGIFVPSSRVAGRTAPPELNFIHRSQILLAAERIPSIAERLLASSSEEVREKTISMIISSRFSWLERGVLDHYVTMARLQSVPLEARKKIVADTRHYISLGDARKEESDQYVLWMRQQHRSLLAAIDDPDPMITVIEVADHRVWRGDEPGTPEFEKLNTLMSQCLADQELFLSAIEMLGDPAKSGGGTFGKMIGANLDDRRLDVILGKIRARGFSQFSFAAVRVAFEADSSRREKLLQLAIECEINNPLVSLSIYRIFGDDNYFQEAARLISSTSIPSKLFNGFFLHSQMLISEAMWSFVDALALRVSSGDEDAMTPLASIVEEFARNNIEDPRGFLIGFPMLSRVESKHRRGVLTEWSEVALWLYKRYPQEVLALAASREQSDYSEATRALAEIAKIDPTGVLNAISPKLKNPYEPPFMLHGDLSLIVDNLSEDVLGEWLRQQPHDILGVFAGHLPKPLMVEGKAVVPPLTRKFWEICTSDMKEAYSRAQELYGAHLFSTGVYTGFGVELFKEQAEIAKQLSNDPNPGIREWAADYFAVSSHRYEDALKRVEIDKARSITDD